jgi:hypothetical protein
MADEMTETLTDRIRMTRARPDPIVDHSDVFDGKGNPLRPIKDMLVANHMRKSGFRDELIVHVLGYMPDLDSPRPTLPDAPVPR